MSRTDKDVPDWYHDGFYEPFHRCKLGAGWNNTDRECDLPELTWKNLKEQQPRRIMRRYCEWTPIRTISDKHWYYRNPTWWYHDVYNIPERVRVRDTVRKALQDYNANGPVDFEYDVPDFRRKHYGGWFW